MATLAPLLTGEQSGAQAVLPPNGFPMGGAELEHRTFPDGQSQTADGASRLRSGVSSPNRAAKGFTAGSVSSALFHPGQSASGVRLPIGGTVTEAMRQAAAIRARRSMRVNDGNPSRSASPQEERLPDPVDLTFPEPPQEQSGAQQSDAQDWTNSEYIRSLPDWAQRYLRQQPGESISATAPMESIINKMLKETPKENQIQWTAPNYRPPENLSHREKGEKRPEPKEQETLRFSDAEIRRMSDRVYRILEDRLRWEKRRLGL